MKTALSEEKFKEFKMKFLARVQEVAHQHKVIPQLIIKWDQTGLNIVPASTWTMEEEGSTRVPIVGLGDMRQITATVGVSMTGEMLPMQILYAGKTERCHPVYSFPLNFDIWHTPNHWQMPTPQFVTSTPSLFPMSTVFEREWNCQLTILRLLCSIHSGDTRERRLKTY